MCGHPATVVTRFVSGRAGGVSGVRHLSCPLSWTHPTARPSPPFSRPAGLLGEGPPPWVPVESQHPLCLGYVFVPPSQTTGLMGHVSWGVPVTAACGPRAVTLRYSLSPGSLILLGSMSVSSTLQCGLPELHPLRWL